MVPCKTGDLEPVTTLVAPLVFAVSCEVDVSGHLRLQPEGSLVLRVQDFLGESWPLYLLLWAPGSPRHFKRHVMGHQGVFHPCEEKPQSLRSIPTVPCCLQTSLQPEITLPILLSRIPGSEHQLLPMRAVSAPQLHGSTTVHRLRLSVAVRLHVCLTQQHHTVADTTPHGDSHPLRGTRGELRPSAEQVCFPVRAQSN